MSEQEQDGQGPRVRVERSRSGYKIGQPGKPLTFYRRVTRFSGALPKPWLGKWAAKEVASFAVENEDSWRPLVEKGQKTDAVKMLKSAPWSKRDDAADRGTAVHRAIESVVTGQELPDMTEEELMCAIQAETFLERFASKVLASELTVFSPSYGYAGTLDLWLVGPDGERWLIDAKTSSSDSVPYTDWTVQQAAYRMAEYAVVQKQAKGDEEWEGWVIEWGPSKVDRVGVLHVGPDQVTLYPINWSGRLFTVFRAAKHIKEWMDDTDDYWSEAKEPVYGEPIRMETEEVEL